MERKRTEKKVEVDTGMTVDRTTEGIVRDTDMSVEEKPDVTVERERDEEQQPEEAE